MNFFFMLRLPGLTTRVTLANYSPSGAMSDVGKIAYLLWSDGSAWQVRDLASVPSGQTLSVNSRDIAHLCPDEDRATPFFCLSFERLAKTMETLPDAHDVETVPAWRANIAIRSPFTATSYQGEYPSGMTQLGRATLVSFAPIFQRLDGAITELLFVNLVHSPRFVPIRIGIGTTKRPRFLMEARAMSNRLTAISLAGMDLDEDEILTVLSPDATGIPIYFSHDADFREMSVEHSHPPVELTVFGKRLAIQSRTKTDWFERFGYAK